ncbi:MAG TPA: aromatic ring-hydroxylating dioxygenase subunit alpha [Candidatus Binataceae bacterium]|nr:aromatic ring-hydroxylating dioxygenase subunit alpha [Candidatus Binataceae bacterium]
MFARNLWYCAGWDYELSQGRDALLARRLANEPIVLYRKPAGGIVAMEDRCPHRQAALHLGRKEGDALRCLYHGMKFGPDGMCVEIPGQRAIPARARVRTLPVVEKDNWIWVWMGDPARADPNLICFAVGPSDPNWNIKTGKLTVKANHRLEIANLMDLSHANWIHSKTLGGTRAWVDVKPTRTPTPLGVNSEAWFYSVPAPSFAQHLFPPDALFDWHVDVQMTLPCNFVIHFKVFTPGTATSGPSNGQMLLDSYSSQAVTPVDEDTCEYYFSWGASKATDAPGMSDMLFETVDAAFQEDAIVLEAQHRNLKERPDGNLVNIVHDAGPEMLLRLLDKRIEEEATEARQAASTRPSRLASAVS